MRGPYTPIIGMALVPFPAQDKWISKVLSVTLTLNSLVIPLPTPPASFAMLKSFKYLKPCQCTVMKISNFRTRVIGEPDTKYE